MDQINDHDHDMSIRRTEELGYGLDIKGLIKSVAVYKLMVTVKCLIHLPQLW